MTPRAATIKTAGQLDRSILGVKGYWILVDSIADKVYIRNQGGSESTTARIEIPRKIFNRLVDFYNADQETSARKRKAS